MAEQSSPKSWWGLILFLAACYLVAGFGAQFEPGAWYQSLQRAPWSPPNMAFPVVWTVLYALIAIAGWHIFAQPAISPKVLWVVQLGLNASWSWVFFGQHWTVGALIIICTLAGLIAWLIFSCRVTGQRLAAWLLMPYLLWVLLASSLNAYIVFYN